MKEIKKNSSKEESNKTKIICVLIPFILGYLSILLEKYIQITTIFEISNMYLFLSGFFMSIGIIVPGVSSTVILTFLGIYGLYLKAISEIDLSFLIPLAIGAIHGRCYLDKNHKTVVF